MNAKWAQRLFEMAELVSQWSKDPIQCVGAAIASPDFRNFSLGYNGFPRGIKDDPARLGVMQTKNQLMVHAELNAILNSSTVVRGWTMATTKFPCSECAKAIIQAGIVCLVTQKWGEGSKWAPQQQLAEEMFKEANMAIIWRLM